MHALVTGHQAIGEHRLLHQVLSTERDELLSEMATIAPLVLAEVPGLDAPAARGRADAGRRRCRRGRRLPGPDVPVVPGQSGRQRPGRSRRRSATLVRSLLLGGILAGEPTIRKFLRAGSGLTSGSHLE